MKNLNVTKKYSLTAQTLLVAAILFVVSPVFVLADPIEVGGNEPSAIEVGGNEPFVSNPRNYSTGGSVSVSSNYPTAFTVSSGGFSGGNSASASSYPYSSYYYVSSGSFYGGSVYSPSYSYPVAPTITVTSGGYSGGDSISTSSYSYPVAPTITVTSGGYSGGDSTSAQSYSYPTAPALTVSSGSYSENGYTPYSYNNYNNYMPLTQNPTPNQVLAYSETPNLTSVALSDVPYTGAGNVLKVILFTLTLILWSIFITYIFLKRKEKNQEVFAVATNEAKISNIVSYKIENQIASDNKALENIENYARAKKILFSTSASAKILKLERLNQINPSVLINKISRNDWVCIGESDLEKYL